jgi:hypothetical protein
MNIKIIVATHKPFRMPDDPMYLPVHCGAVGKESIGYQRDDEGENISHKNANYCELTGLYWAWKNLPDDVDVVGLVHYRRYFSDKRFGNKWHRLLTKHKIERSFEKADVILPKKRRYFIETNYSHYIHAHKPDGLEIVKEIINARSAAYSRAWGVMANRTWAHMFNMFIMKRHLFNEYCEWLYNVLEVVYDKIDMTGYNSAEARLCGYLGELLLDIWLIERCLKIDECNIMFMEKQNWVIKGYKFIRRKFVR